MWPTWPQLGSQDGTKMEKIDAKINQKLNASWKQFFDAILVDFGRENGGKLASQNDQKSKPPLKRKNQLNISGLDFSWFSRLQVGSQNRSKIDQKMKSKMKFILASIFKGFWWIFGSKLESKIYQKSIQKGLENCSPFGQRPGPARRGGS